ncbi:hypothetical protein LEP1GSC050_2803 [Leptospira broomii serovar Hurstbridge str. 5399]|uniref:Apea-like HEPN domain-containing protein n=1 Tax=Leptospira broomii serovar Hurstbridge str. 5399 TaxID=1049789 RepID=T0GHI7_9LEPT|nr:hypothetical protein LEP1GSC050_2803 [Leptospira broomii serovar Hurstbridge str. 5399]
MPGGEEQAILDKIGSLHKIHSQLEIYSGTLIRYKDELLISILEEKDLSRLYLFSDVLAFSALSSRQFFSYNYTNKSSFQLFVYPYDEKKEHISIISRRTDGEAMSAIPLEYYSVIRPFYCCDDSPKCDQILISKIYEFAQITAGKNIFESIQIFNIANTDSDQLYKHIEITLLCGALERLFGINGGKYSNLEREFTKYVQPKMRVEPKHCDRIKNYPKQDKVNSIIKKGKSLTEVWLSDFFLLRGEYAHGRIRSSQEPIWSLSEHILFSSFIFPLVVKAMMNKNLDYELNSSDKLHLDSFELLLCSKPFEGNKPETHSFTWNNILTKASSATILFNLMNS